jgi:LAO/AO transport system kinase
VTFSEPDALAERVASGDRRAIARAITLVESTRADHRDQAIDLLETLRPRTGQSIRIGISGAPGAGKSTFIEAFGLHAIGAARKVAVLAVDPTSAQSGGSILGDKTRMSELARRPEAYVRPSPSGGALGGVGRRTREAVLVCEGAGFDTVIVETVGVGQSEVEVDAMVDVFVLLVAPGSGDELQGIKRGITELADLIVVTKADGELRAAANAAAADYRHALHLLRPKYPNRAREVMLCSAVTGEGIADVWQAVEHHYEELRADGSLQRRRADQSVAALWVSVEEQLVERIRAGRPGGTSIDDLERQVAAGELTPARAAAELISEASVTDPAESFPSRAELDPTPDR